MLRGLIATRLLGVSLALSATVVPLRVGAGQPAAGAEALVISTLPFDDPNQQRAVFSVLSEQLSPRLGRPVRFEAGQSYQSVIARLNTGEVDVAFLGAASYLEARRAGNVRAILRSVRHGKATYRGAIFVKRGSPVRSIALLEGRRVAFVDEHSTTGYHFPMRMLREAGLDPARDIDSVFAGGHHKVVQMVASGEVDAGAAFEGAEVALRDPSAVVVIGFSRPAPGDPVVVRTGLGRRTIEGLRSALIELATNPEAAAFFAFAEIDGFVPAADRDYDAVSSAIRGSGGRK